MMTARFAQEAAACWGLYDVTRAHHPNSAIARVCLLWLHLNFLSEADLRQLMIGQTTVVLVNSLLLATVKQATVSFRPTTLSSTYFSCVFRVSRR